MKSKTHKYYGIRLAGMTSFFSANSYSKYYKRMAQATAARQHRGWMLYGLAQAREHIKELRQSVYGGKRQYVTADFEIVRVVTSETVVQTSRPSPAKKLTPLIRGTRMALGLPVE